MDLNSVHIKKVATNLIKVDFRRERLSIDFDPYFDGVKEVHCRKCGQRKPREGATELIENWGYLCRNCHESYIVSGSVQNKKEDNISRLSSLR